MATSKSYVYVGLGGETAAGRPIQSGLYRMVEGDGGWESLTTGLPQAPAIRSVAIHPLNPAIVYAGTQAGTLQGATITETTGRKSASPTTAFPFGRSCSIRGTPR